MAKIAGTSQAFNIVIIGQSGRLQYECLLFAASLRHASPSWRGRLFVAEPQPGPLWSADPSIRSDAVRDQLRSYGVEFLPFTSRHFGQSYPQGNKIEALAEMPEGEPFLFFDSDTLITGELGDIPFDFARPAASLRREGTWPEPTLYGPGYDEIWRSLYDRFGLDFESSLDVTCPEGHWRRYLYFNAGWFFYECPRRFGARFLDYARTIRDDPPRELAGQTLDPWLDQIALPLVIHSLNGGRDALPDGVLDGDRSCHYRHIPLLYAREPDHVVDLLEQVAAPNRLKKLLKDHEAYKRLIYQGRGRKLRAQIDRAHLPRREQVLRNRIRALGFWMR